MSKAQDYFKRRNNEEEEWNGMSKTPPWNGDGHVDPQNKGKVPPYEPYVPPADDEEEEEAPQVDQS